MLLLPILFLLNAGLQVLVVLLVEDNEPLNDGSVLGFLQQLFVENSI